MTDGSVTVWSNDDFCLNMLQEFKQYILLTQRHIQRDIRCLENRPERKAKLVAAGKQDTKNIHLLYI